MNQLNGKNNVRQINQPHIKSAQLETMPSLEKNNILSENDEYCYELDQSSYSISDTNKSKKSNNSNTIQMISELSDLSINNNEPLKYINHLPVIKTSVGTIENVKIAKVNNLVNTIKELKDKGYWVIGTDMQGDNYKSIDYTGKIVIIIGNEGKGISRLVKENCDFTASIPMRGKVNSLNASVAAALLIYEVMDKNVW